MGKEPVVGVLNEAAKERGFKSENRHQGTRKHDSWRCEPPQAARPSIFSY